MVPQSCSVARVTCGITHVTRGVAQDEFEFAFKKVMVMLCREQRIEMFVKVDLDCRCG